MVYCLLMMLIGAFMGFVYLRLNAITAKATARTWLIRSGKVVFSLPVILMLILLLAADISAQSTHYASAFVAGAVLSVMCWRAKGWNR